MSYELNLHRRQLVLYRQNLLELRTQTLLKMLFLRHRRQQLQVDLPLLVLLQWRMPLQLRLFGKQVHFQC
jgi:hypothetical protein